MPKILRCSRTKVTSDAGSTISIRAATSQHDNRWVSISFRDNSAWVRYDQFATDKVEARRSVTRQGVVIISDRDWNKVVAAVAKLTHFPPRNIIESPGWTKDYFALADGTVFPVADAKPAIVTFERNGQKLDQEGSIEAWHDSVAVPIIKQHIPAFMVMAAFAAPLLDLSDQRLNFGFEICGPGGTGKSTCQAIMASVVGSPNYMIDFNATIAGLEATMQAHACLPMIIDEVNLIQAGNNVRAQADFLKDVAFKLANGTPKRTHFRPEQATYRFVFVTSANQPFHRLLKGVDKLIADSALERLIPIMVPQENEFGIFDFLPDEYATSAHFARHLEHAVSCNFGTPMKSFLEHLVRARAKDETRLRCNILKCVCKFEKSIGVADTKWGGNRVTGAFGLVYAAGVFAKLNGILPASWDCLGAAVTCYRNYQRQLPHRTPLVARLITIAEDSGTMLLQLGNLPKLTDADVCRHGAFLRPGMGGRMELLLTRAARDQYFPDWKSLEMDSDFNSLCNREDGRTTVKRQIRSNKKSDRVVCFKLPESASLSRRVGA